MVRGGPRRHGHLSFGSDIADRDLRRNIVDMFGTGSYKGKKHLYYKSMFQNRKKEVKIVVRPSTRKGRTYAQA